MVKNKTPYSILLIYRNCLPSNGFRSMICKISSTSCKLLDKFGYHEIRAWRILCLMCLKSCIVIEIVKFSLMNAN